MCRSPRRGIERRLPSFASHSSFEKANRLRSKGLKKDCRRCSSLPGIYPCHGSSICLVGAAFAKIPEEITARVCRTAMTVRTANKQGTGRLPSHFAEITVTFFLILNGVTMLSGIWSLTFHEFEHIADLHRGTGGKILSLSKHLTSKASSTDVDLKSTEAPLLGWPSLPLLLGPS